MSSVDRILVPSLSPGSSHAIVLPMTSPAEHGVYSAQWRLSTFTGTPFGGFLPFLPRCWLFNLFVFFFVSVFLCLCHLDRCLEALCFGV